MHPNNQTPPDESKIGQEPVRCNVLTRAGIPCKNLAIADGRCWIHGGRKNKFPTDEENILKTENAAGFVQEGIDAKNAGSGGMTGAAAEAIEISAADIELISEEEAPKGLPEAAASPPAEAGQPEIVWNDEMPDKAAPVTGAGDLEILWDDSLPDEEPPEEGMELGIEIDATEPVAVEFEDLELELLPDDELPADNEDTKAGLSGEAPDNVSAAENEDIIFEILPGADSAPEADAADIEIVLKDDTVFDSAGAVITSGDRAASGPADDWLGMNDINRFGAAAGQPQLKDMPEVAAPESGQPSRHVPQEAYPPHPDKDASNVAPEYKSRTTIGKFQAVHVNTPRRRELKKATREGAPAKKPASFWRRRVGIPAPVFWGMTWLLLILGGVSGLHYGFGIRIPYASDMLTPAVKDAGNLKITVYGIESRFVQNSHSGMLLVITGWVRNDYNAPRGLIRVTGRLFTHNNFVKSQTVYCGDLLADEELGGLAVEVIQKRLSGQFDDRGPKEVIVSRQTLPFMIVFSQLPNDLASLEKYTVEVTGSSQIK